MSVSPDPGTVSVEIDDIALSYADQGISPSPIPLSFQSETQSPSQPISGVAQATVISSSQTTSGIPQGTPPNPQISSTSTYEGGATSLGYLPTRVETPSLQEFAASSSYEPLPEDFFRTIFYFSGMGRVIGSALNEGVHVDERQREKAIDAEQLPPHLREQLHRDEYPLVISCRNQAHNIYNGLKNLHSLLDQVPTYTDSSRPVTYRPTSTEPTSEPTVDDPIHGHRYFRDNRMRDSLGGGELSS